MKKIRSHIYPKCLVSYWINSYKLKKTGSQKTFIHKINLDNLEKNENFDISSKEQQEFFLDNVGFYLNLNENVKNLEEKWNETEKQIAIFCKKIFYLKKQNLKKDSSKIKSLNYIVKSTYKKNPGIFLDFIKITIFRSSLLLNGPLKSLDSEGKYDINWDIIREMSEIIHSNNLLKKQNGVSLLEKKYEEFIKNIKFPGFLISPFGMMPNILPEFPIIFGNDENDSKKINFVILFLPFLGPVIFIEPKYRILISKIDDRFSFRLVDKTKENFKFESGVFVSKNIKIPKSDQEIMKDFYTWFLYNWMFQLGKFNGDLFFLSEENKNWEKDELLKWLSEIRNKNLKDPKNICPGVIVLKK